MGNGQLGLLLWKNYVIRKRQPVILGLVFLWPIAIFMILYSIRHNLPTDYNPTCQFPARLMPHDGLLPFVQSFICSIPNTCDPLDEYEEIPSYKNATLTPLLGTLQPMIMNDTIVGAVRALPKSIQLLKSMAQILTRPEIKQLFYKGVELNNLFTNHETLKNYIRNNVRYVDEDFLDGLFEGAIRLLYLVKSLSSLKVDEIICSPEKLSEFLLVPEEEDLRAISKFLCELDPKKVPDMILEMTSHLEFSGLLELVGKITAKFRSYDFFEDIKDTIVKVLNLDMVEKYVPAYLKIREWVPEIIPLFKNTTFKEIDLNFINQAIVVLDPIFADTSDWKIARSGFLKINTMLGFVKKVVEFKKSNTRDNVGYTMDSLGGKVTLLQSLDNYELITEILDQVYLILLDGIKLTRKLLDIHKAEINLHPDVFDGLKNTFSKKIVNLMSYSVSFTTNVVRMVYQIAYIHEEGLRHLYEVCIKHKDLVQALITEGHPDILRAVMQAFSRLTFVEKLIQNEKQLEPAELMCDLDTLKEIFDDWKNFDPPSLASKKIDVMITMICNEKSFITDLYDMLRLKEFEDIVQRTLATFINMALQQPVKIQTANLTFAMGHIKKFVAYLDTKTNFEADWDEFNITDEWAKVFEESRGRGRMNILGLHLSIAKQLGFESMSYFVIRPDLQKMDILAENILAEIHTPPTEWIDQFRMNLGLLEESFYLTLTDRGKTLKILESTNFTKSYCSPNAPSLINYPKGSNEVLLKSLICRVAVSVQTHLQLNVTDILENDPRFFNTAFNWTAFNAKVVDIYGYVDSLVRAEEQRINPNTLAKLREDFKQSWTEDLNAREALEISVGSLCYVCDIMEKPLFGIQSKSLYNWKNIYAVAWATSVIFDSFERVIDKIQSGTDKDVLEGLPETEALLDIFLRNLQALIYDLVDLVTQKGIMDIISTIDDYAELEPEWPCVEKKSFGEALGFRNGTVRLIKQIEKISCEPDPFIKEWLDQPIMSKANKMLLDQDSTVSFPAFNWTAGYLGFRRLLDKFESLLDSKQDVTLTRNQEQKVHPKKFAPQVEKLVQDRTPRVKFEASNFLDFIDIQLNKMTKIFNSEMSASDIWRDPSASGPDKILILTKFISHFVYKATLIMADVVKDGEDSISLLSLTGFTSTSVIGLFHDKLPYIAATLVNGMSDRRVQFQMAELWAKESKLSCPEFFSWWSSHLIGLTLDDYRTLKNFACHLEPEHFNAFVDLFHEETKIWNKPAVEYRPHFATLAGELYGVAMAISRALQRGATFEAPFTDRYFMKATRTMKNALDVKMKKVKYSTGELEIINSKHTIATPIYRMFIQAFSETVNNIAQSLQGLKVVDDKIEVWQLFSNNRVQELIKIFEDHPLQTISLMASLSWVDPKTDRLMENLGGEMCARHFHLNYWEDPANAQFLKELCSFNYTGFLAAMTSPEFAAYLHDPTEANENKLTPLKFSVRRFLAVVIDLTEAHPRLSVQSDAFNAKTFQSLPNDTWFLINRAVGSWVHHIFANDKGSSASGEEVTRWPATSIDGDTLAPRVDPFVRASKLAQVLAGVTDLFSGGDVWQKLRNVYERSRVKLLLELVEATPDLVIATVETFIATDKITEFVNKLFTGRAMPCDVDSYLVPPKYIRNKGYINVLNHFCKDVLSKHFINAHEFLDFDFNEPNVYVAMDLRQSLNPLARNETQLTEKIMQIQRNLIKYFANGFEQLEVPSWWRAFKRDTFDNFHAIYKSKDSRALAHLIVEKTFINLREILLTLPDAKNCSWCNTLLLDIFNSQLSQHSQYGEFICKMARVTYAESVDILLHEFHWDKTVAMVKDFKELNVQKNVESFVEKLEITVHYIADILVDFQVEAYHKRVTECFHKLVGKPAFSRPGLYSKVTVAIVDGLGKNIDFLDNYANHQNMQKLSKLSEEKVPIWIPLRDVVKKADVDYVERHLPKASINVNMISTGNNGSLCSTSLQCKDPGVIFTALNSTRQKKLFHYDEHDKGLSMSLTEISQRLAKSLDFEAINSQRSFWRKEAADNYTWLKVLMQHVIDILESGGDLLDVASKIDMSEGITKAVQSPELIEGIGNLLKDKTVNKLFTGLKDMIEDIEPFIEDKPVVEDLFSMINAFESMEIFKNIEMLDIKFFIKDLFNNWDEITVFLKTDIEMPREMIRAIGTSKVDMFAVFSRQSGVMGLKTMLCSPQLLNEILSFEHSRITIEQVSSTLCQLTDEQTQGLIVTLISNINFEYLVKNLMSASIENIVANANLTEEEGREVMKSLGIIAELVPFFRDRLSSGFSEKMMQEDEETEQSSSGQNSMKFLAESSEMLCGKPLISANGRYYKMITELQDMNTEYDQNELNSLPNEFCRDTYKNAISMPAGKILWSFVKPILRGQILFTPNTPKFQYIMHLANGTFAQMDRFGDLMSSFAATLGALMTLPEMQAELEGLKEVMSTDVMKSIIQTLSDGKFDGDMTDFDVGAIAMRLKNSRKLVGMIDNLNHLIGCVLINRTRGIDTNRELEVESLRLKSTNDFLAAVVFTETSERGFEKRSLDFSDDITYKIRMDVDSVPSTKRIKNQFWTPGPESNFIENMRYIRGFIQLQDAIDKAIIMAKTQRNATWTTVTQQMPYPCWKYSQFQSIIYESQGVQVTFFFALMMSVGTAVRFVIWERESRNEMVMSVMGLKPWGNIIAWFITTFVELTIAIACIATILLAGDILSRSDPTIVIFWLMEYVVSIVAFCFMLSSIFSSASLGAVSTVILFYFTFLPYIVVIGSEANLAFIFKLLVCLSMSSSFCYGGLFTVRRELQGTGMQWHHLWEEAVPGDPMTMGWVFVMLAVDACIYALIGFIVTKYANSGKGFHGLRSRCLWWNNGCVIRGRYNSLAFVNNLYVTNEALHPSDTYCSGDESDASSLTVNEKQIGVKFEGVRKVYHTNKGEVVAVDSFTLKLCEGEVTCLLGRNGAGKTTIIKMLTGMVAPTSGEICLNGEEGSKPDIGVCPQDNVLIDSLTPREHMIFYLKLKRMESGMEMQRNVNAMMASMELGHKEHEPVNRLSGGTRRRLCVALAFLGAPKLVILDEPGSGVDPAARRRIWRLIDKHRAGRTVLLSTHHLDEADMLSDVVVVMHNGRILCTGSPVSLKMSYGRGYTMTIEFPLASAKDSPIDGKAIDVLKNLIEPIVPNYSIDAISNSELQVTLPFQGKYGSDNDIGATARLLEDNKKILGYKHFSLECDSLERVFLDLCAKAEDKGLPPTKAVSMNSVTSVETLGLSIPKDDVNLIREKLTMNPTVTRQMKALLKKRMWHFTRDWRAPLAALILPSIFVAAAMGFSLIRPSSGDDPPLHLTPDLYNIHPMHFYSVDNSSDPFLQDVAVQIHERFGDDYAGAWQIMPDDSGTCECQDGQQYCTGLSKGVEGLLQTLPDRPMLDWLVSTQQEYIEKRYGGWSLSHTDEKPLFVVWYNNKGWHALPAYLNAVNDAILRAFGSYGRITAINHPIELSSDQLNRTSLMQHIADVGIALVLLVAFSMVGAQGARELVRERISEEKRILYLAGVHPVTYWVTALIWDFFVFLATIGLAVVVFEIFQLPPYVARENLPGIVVLLITYAWAAIPLTHLVEKLFNDPSISNMVIFCTNTMIAVFTMGTILAFDITGESEAADEIRRVLHNIFLVLPQYAGGDALVSITRNDITYQLLSKFNMDTYQSPLGWDLIGPHKMCLLIMGAVLFALNLIIECQLLPRFRSSEVTYENVQEDEDIVKERVRVETAVTSDVLRTVKLRKEYKSVYGTNVAVQNLSFGVESGTCFGLLGVNGAGKSTTFKMLTTEVRPTAGKIVVRGEEIGDRPLSNGEVGYCPQSDALDGFLTPHQCLTIHGEVCGLYDVPRMVEAMLTRFELVKYAHRRVDRLSGGNKRKLCTAISVMSPVSVVLMDEPTSGMDPATKELVAAAIRYVTRNQASVIMTSHSVADCESLCSRVGILVRGGYKCIGTPQYLKHRYGEGYVGFLRFSQLTMPSDLNNALQRHLPHAAVSSRQARAARIMIPQKDEVPLSAIFTKMKLVADELKATDYNVTQSSLDQVLVNFSEELEDDVERRAKNVAGLYGDNILLETF